MRDDRRLYVNLLNKIGRYKQDKSQGQREVKEGRKEDRPTSYLKIF